jgi:hypothetical protein
MSFLRENPVVFATMATGCTVVVALIPPVNTLVWLIVMVPLWIIDANTGIDLGELRNGFFAPNMLAWVSVTMPFWIFWFCIGVNLRKRSAKTTPTAT